MGMDRAAREAVEKFFFYRDGSELLTIAKQKAGGKRDVVGG